MKQQSNSKIHYPILILFILIVFTANPHLYAQNRWFEDRAMNYKINVPVNYQTNQLIDGTDKIQVFVSPDQNLVIRIRSFKLNQPITELQLQSVFEQNIINGAIRIMDEQSNLNGLPARWSGYSWLYNNVSTILTNYYIVRPDFAYVVWSICAENMPDQKTAELSNILGSFTLINGHPQTPVIAQPPNQSGSSIAPQANTNSLNHQQSASTNQSVSAQTTNTSNHSSSRSGIDVFAIGIGTGITTDLQITNPTTTIPPSSPMIHAVFNYNGHANGQNFEVKWFSKTHNCLIIEDSYLPAINGKNQIHSSIENSSIPWPVGEYRAELWMNGENISGRNFAVGTPSTNGSLLGKCWTDGKGNNQTKSLGGKYYSLDLNTVKDNDLFEVKVTSGSLQFVTIHYRNSSGVWYTAYKGPNTKFRVGDLLNGKRNLFTHLIINVNAEHEKYLSVACYADIVLNPGGQAPPVTQMQQQTTNTPAKTTSSSSGKVSQIILDNTNNTYDFDSGRVCSIKDNPEPDVINEPWCTALPALCGNWAKTGKSRMEDVTTAPTSGFISDGKSFVDCQECPVNEVLVFKNKEGRLGKLMIIKDEKTQTANGCQHRITCLVEFPAF